MRAFKTKKSKVITGVLRYGKIDRFFQHFSVDCSPIFTAMSCVDDDMRNCFRRHSGGFQRNLRRGGYHQREKYRDKKDNQEYVEKPFHIQNTTSALAYAVQRRFYHFYYNAVKDSWQQKYLLWLIAESDIIKIKDR